MADTVDNYGRLQRKGTAIPIREDFNTLDDPFSWLPGDTALRAGKGPALHFVALVPSHLAFHKAQFAMDGYTPDGTKFKMADGSGLPVTDRRAGIKRHRDGHAPAELRDPAAQEPLVPAPELLK